MIKINRKCSDLKLNENVVFKVSVYGDEEEIYDGNVLSVNKNNNTVTVCYLEGYHSRTDNISFKNMLAVYDENGEYMKFDNISGKSALLIAE